MNTGDTRDIKRRVLADAIGVVCDIDGAVHVHLTNDLDAEAAATSDVLLEVATERMRRREHKGTDEDDERSDADWRELHVDCLLDAFPKRRGCDKVKSRSHLIRCISMLSAHVEAMDRKAAQQ